MKKNKIAFQGGAYSLAITAIVLAILIAVNVFASVLPASLTKFDISATQLYSITSNTKVVVNALEKDVTIYWIVQSEQEDDVIENLLAKYENLSDHIEVVKKNPDVFPTFAEQYTSETVYNNSLVVECGDKSRFIAYDEIYISEVDYSTYETSYEFDGEGAITSAIDYVVSDDLPIIYLLEGHGEAELPSAFSEQIQKENMETMTFSLLTDKEIPEDADCVMIYAPSTDISAEEKEILSNYVENGGKLMVMAGPTENGTLENLYDLLGDYGVEPAEGIVVEGNSYYYAFQMPYILLPEISGTTFTSALVEEAYYVIVPIAQGLVTSGDSVTSLLTTSSEAFSKIKGYDLDTYEKEEGDVDGPFSVAVSVECGNEGQMIWVSSSVFMDDIYNEYSSGANLEFAMNGLAELIGETEAVSIRSKSLDYNYLTISESTSEMLKKVMIGAIPIAYLAVGIVIVVRRRGGNEKG